MFANYNQVRYLDEEFDNDMDDEEFEEVEVEIIENRGFVIGPTNCDRLYNKGYYGEFIDKSKLQLSLVEILYLLDKSRIYLTKDGKEMSYEEAFKYASENELEFDIKFIAFKDLRKRGYVVKSGFKFGAHFRVYDRGQVPGKDHSNFLVHAISEGKTFSFPEISRAVRLAHSVRKRFIYAIVDDDGSLTYYKILRAKM